MLSTVMLSLERMMTYIAKDSLTRINKLVILYVEYYIKRLFVTIRYKVYSWEAGYPDYSPYHETDDKDEAEVICKYIANKHNVRAHVFDNIRNIDYFCDTGTNTKEK